MVEAPYSSGKYLLSQGLEDLFLKSLNLLENSPPNHFIKSLLLPIYSNEPGSFSMGRRCPPIPPTRMEKETLTEKEKLSERRRDRKKKSDYLDPDLEKDIMIDNRFSGRVRKR
ncbi:hypothetical protein CEXT_799941 [Caerostris extrusa]|uniref:Mediator of RNA polymerase II transcription subunit 19 n=1 Tax=Caerostris extrusa TaxID=172846 RepID=A0AAV4QDU1_CAEEX|nr:hypothetical protein CEXT_799941 [Caerostris extrusa]